MIDPARLHGPILDSTWDILRLDFLGIAFGALFFCWSLTPSLLPRDWLFQGIIGGIDAAIGYAIGTVVSALARRYVLRRYTWWPVREPWATAGKAFVVVTSALVSLVMLVYSAGWQREIARLMDVEGTTTSGYIRTIALSALVAATLVALWRVLRDIVRWIAGRLIRTLRLSVPVATTIGVVVVVVLSLLLVDGILLRGTYSAVNSAFSLENDGTQEGIEQPSSPEKSGSPDSLAPWDTLGLQGRNFVARGLDSTRLEQSSGKPAKEPIRVYAGLETAEDTDARLDVVVKELERTGAFQREVLVVIPTTGTGWVNPTAAEAIELVHNGDSALVAAQYSYLPSWISFLADRDKAAEAGRRLVDKVRDRWLQEPVETRPKLMVYGESLGTQAGEGAFANLAELRAKVDGVLWVGPPNSNPLWRSLVERRDPGTREIDPTYADGLVVRFANDAAGIGRGGDTWLTPRVLYVQHPSDPVVWWSPDLLFNRPDWLHEVPGYDRTPSMKWFPFVTFWQVSADLANAAGVPDGHGHNYGTLVLDGWVSVAQPEGWTPDDTERARATLDAYRDTEGPEK
ncbi:alpha/beta hydrolase [Rhodococcus sp. HNM0569]|uniref:alpha/beta hydrolase n=1 Tax=Rhodococcus sp. HNM0569 TaxID=2716340 RepID=UPI00197F65BA|nr:alpha/beta hydrolase [Rhodococcus sp. HNM0569]